MSVDYTAKIVYGCPIGYEEYNRLIVEDSDEYVYCIDCYSDDDSTFILGFPVLSCDPGEMKNINEAEWEKEDKAKIFYICDKYNIDTKSIGYYLVNRVS